MSIKNTKNANHDTSIIEIIIYTKCSFCELLKIAKKIVKFNS